MMTVTRVSAAIAAALLLAAGVAPGWAQDEIASTKLRIEWAEFKPLYDAKKVVVVDVRTEEAFEVGHIPGALSVPLDEVEGKAGELKKLGRPIVFYCA